MKIAIASAKSSSQTAKISGKLADPRAPRPRFGAMSYAIISLGGKQYRVQEGERLLVDRLPTEEGKTFHPEVLMVGGAGEAAGGLRRHDGEGDRREGRKLVGRAGRGGARVRAGARQAQGRAGRAASAGGQVMAHKKGLGSSRNGRDSKPKMLGVKVFAGQEVKAGMIIVRQRGTKFRPGAGTGIGRDDTIFATRPGTVAFRQSGERRFIEVSEAPE